MSQNRIYTFEITVVKRMADNKTSFLLKNLSRGFLYLGVIVVLFILAKKYISVDYILWLAPVYEKPSLMFGIFMISEIIIGIIPPEFFMVWALRTEILSDYIWTVFLLTIISYLSGVIGFGIGRYFSTTLFYRFLKRKYIGKYSKYLNEYGGFLIVVAAVTPLPWSGISMLVGSEKYPFKRFFVFSLFRFLRFIVYAAIIWEANIL